MSTSISVVGTGYLGVTHAACMAELGHEVIAYDVDASKIDALAEGVLPFFEPELEGLVRRHTATGRLRFTTSVAEAGREGGRALHLRGYAAAAGRAAGPTPATSSRPSWRCSGT